MVDFLGAEDYFWLAIIVLYLLLAFEHKSRRWRYHLIFFVCALSGYLWITGRISQFLEWTIAHKVEIRHFVLDLFWLSVFIIIIAIIIKYRVAILNLLGKCWEAILKSAIVIFVVKQIKFILLAIWMFLNTSFGFCFTFIYGLSLAAIKINPELVQAIYQIPLYILNGAMSVAVALILATIYNRVHPHKLYHSMAYYNSNPNVISYSENIKGPSKVEWEFYSPDGNLYGTKKSLDIPPGWGTCWYQMVIPETKEINTNGKWRVDIFRNSKKIATNCFVLIKEKE